MSAERAVPPLERILDTPTSVEQVRLEGEGPAGRLPITAEMLRAEPSGNLFGMTQDAGMGWNPPRAARARSTSSSARRAACAARTASRSRSATTPDTGRSACSSARAAETLREEGGRAVRRLLQRSVRRPHAGHDGDVRQPAVPQRRRDHDAPADSIAADARPRVMGIATCDKGLPATMLALAGCGRSARASSCPAA